MLSHSPRSFSNFFAKSRSDRESSRGTILTLVSTRLKGLVSSKTSTTGPMSPKLPWIRRISLASSAPRRALRSTIPPEAFT